MRQSAPAIKPSFSDDGILPAATSGNTNAPTVRVAEKRADLSETNAK